MNSLKAIVSGVLFIIIVTLVLQLIFLLLAVSYAELAQDYPVLQSVRGYFRYVVGIPVALLVMFLGGYLTAAIARTRVIVHCIITATISLLIAIVPALDYSSITIMGAFTLGASFAFTVLGGWYWYRKYDVRNNDVFASA